MNSQTYSPHRVIRVRLQVLWTVLVLILMAPVLVRAQGVTPPTVSYQGRVMMEGAPFEGAGFFKFVVVDQGGDSAWSNDGTSAGGGEPVEAVTLPVSAGLFNVLLGDPDLSMVPLEHWVFNDPQSVLRTWFSPDGGDFSLLEPDLPIATAPYAFVAQFAHDADTVDGQHAAAFAATGHTHWGQTWSGSGTGLTLTSSGWGLDAETSSSSLYATAVRGHAVASSGQTVGVKGSTESESDGTIGVWGQAGKADGIGYGALGQTFSDNPDSAGIRGTATLGAAGSFSSTLGVGVVVHAESWDGVRVLQAGDDGLHVYEADSDGVHVGQAGSNGVFVEQPVDDGLQVGYRIVGESVGPGDDGIEIVTAGVSPKVTLPADAGYAGTQDGIDIGGVPDFGLWIGYAGGTGLRVQEAGSYGVYVEQAGFEGVHVRSAGTQGVVVEDAGSDGLYVYSSDDEGLEIHGAGSPSDRIMPSDAGYGDTHDGVDINGAEDFGLWVGHAGQDGVHVNTAQGTGVYAQAQEGAGVQGESERGIGGHFTSTQSHALVSQGPALIGGRNPAQIGMLQWYEASTTWETISSKDGPSGLTFDGDHVWVVHQGSGRLLKIRASDGYQEEEYSNIAFSGGSVLLFDGLRLWTRGGGSGGVFGVYARNGSELGDPPSFDNSYLDLLGGEDIYDLIWDGEWLWAATADGLRSAVTVPAVPEYSDLTTVHPFAGQALAFDGTHIWLAAQPASLQKLSRNGDLLGTYAVGANPVALAFDGAHIWTANYDDNTVSKVRAADGQPMGTYTVGQGPTDIIFDGYYIWVANKLSNTVTKMRALDGSRITSYEVGQEPVALVFDGAHVWVANYADDTLTKL